AFWIKHALVCSTGWYLLFAGPTQDKVRYEIDSSQPPVSYSSRKGYQCDAIIGGQPV
ncbi:hypothetical protein HAX54_049346, partial [Datura stramonium]|nr:hypothetical protein [Datura stramonium]